VKLVILQSLLQSASSHIKVTLAFSVVLHIWDESGAEIYDFSAEKWEQNGNTETEKVNTQV
jgi:hypothetical protein